MYSLLRVSMYHVFKERIWKGIAERKYGIYHCETIFENKPRLKRKHGSEYFINLWSGKAIKGAVVNQTWPSVDKINLLDLAYLFEFKNVNTAKCPQGSCMALAGQK